MKGIRPAVRPLLASLVVIAAVSLMAALPAAAAAAQTAAVLYQQGVAARSEQRLEDARSLLEQAAALEAGNADVQVQLGFTHSALGHHALARTAFDRALAIAPEYQDANFGLAQIAFRVGSLEEARAWVETFLDRRPDDVEAAALLASIEKAEAANVIPPASLGAPALSASLQQRLATTRPRKWRLDLGSETSDLSGGRSSWTDSAIGLVYQATPAATVSGRLRHAARWGRSDVQLESRLDYAPTGDWSFHGLVAATPDAHFLAEQSIGAGALWRAGARRAGGGPLYLNLDLRHDRYPGSDVTTVSPGVQHFLFDERLGLALRWVGSRDDGGTSASGYLLRGDVVATDRLRLFIGHADAPEIADGALVKVRTTFTGISFDLTDGITLNLTYAHETRDAFERDTVGASLSLRF